MELEAKDQAADVNSAVIRLAFDGESLSDGSMNIRDLAPALLDIAALIERANYLLNGNSAEISVRIDASFKRGSFEFFPRIVQHIKEKFRAPLLGQATLDSTSLARLLGLVGGSGHQSVFGLWKLLKGRDLQEEAVADRDIIQSIPEELRHLYRDPGVRARVASVLRPVSREGINEFLVKEAEEVSLRNARASARNFASSGVSLKSIAAPPQAAFRCSSRFTSFSFHTAGAPACTASSFARR